MTITLSLTADKNIPFPRPLFLDDVVDRVVVLLDLVLGYNPTFCPGSEPTVEPPFYASVTAPRV